MLAAAFSHLVAASPAVVCELVMLSTLITAHSDGLGSFRVQSASRLDGLVLLCVDGVCSLLEEAAEDKAMVIIPVSEGVVAGVWKKSKGEPKL